MHAFHEYLSGQLQEKLEKRRVVVWYDARGEFVPFIDELATGAEGELPEIAVGDVRARLARFGGSFFALRLLVEPMVAADTPDTLLVYLPQITRDRKSSPLLELELGGVCYEPQLKRLARNVLRRFHGDGSIDEMLGRDRVTYQDIVAYIEQSDSGGHTSILDVVFPRLHEPAQIIAQWLADDSLDKTIVEKEGSVEIYKLIRSRLGLDLGDVDLITARARTVRYALVNEFRADLQCPPPQSIAQIPAPASQDQQAVINDVGQEMRRRHSNSYPSLADKVEVEMNLGQAGLKAADLGDIDTFRFEEKLLLAYCGELICANKYDPALKLIEGRRHSFWAQSDVRRQAQWEACRLMAELGRNIDKVGSAVHKTGGKIEQWVKNYVDAHGWFLVDQFHRNLESWIAKMDDDPAAEEAVLLLRRRYEDLLGEMSSRFARVLVDCGWSVPGVLHQTRIYPEVVEISGGRTAYFLVDALRFEMGVALAQQLPDTEDLAIRPAVAALPTITKIGMAALLPGASAGFSTTSRDKLAAVIDNAALSTFQDRQKFLKARLPEAKEVELGKLLQMTKSQLGKSLGKSSPVIIRSQEIDSLGETGGDWMARQLMDTIVGNIARAVRKLAQAGVEYFVITADHGYQFSLKKEEDMRTDNPGGDTVEIHRRCWIGHGGQTPPGTVRVPGAKLGYDTDLDFIFPEGMGVFRAHGGLSFHHGGISLQEMIIPVITLRIPSLEEERASGVKVYLSDCPKVLTNRTFGIKVGLHADLFETNAVHLRIVLFFKKEEVGRAGMAIGAEFDRATGCVRLMPGENCDVGMMLTQDCEKLRVVVLDPRTDAVLTQSDEITVNLSI